MPETVNQVSIFVPVLVIVALTFVAFARMGAARGRAVKEGMDPTYYRAHLGGAEPEYATAATRHYGNLFEMPVLFYFACVVSYLLGAVTVWTLVFAWAFVAGRLVQSAVHLTYNNPMHRGFGFMLCVLSMLVFWVDIALVVFRQL